MATEKVVKNDVGYRLSFTLTNQDGVAVNLTDSTVTVTISGGITRTKLTRTCVVNDATAGKCYYDLIATDTAVPGNYTLSVIITYASKKYTTVTTGSMEIVEVV